MACSDSPQLDGEILLAMVLGKTRTYLHTWPELELDSRQLDSFEGLLQRRLAGEPVAYITGQREFWSLDLKVTPDTLIPRPETEILVEQALERIPSAEVLDILDIGTGSGAIAVAIAKERPRCVVVGTDVSAAALVVARENAGTHGCGNLTFLEGGWFGPVTGRRFHVIVSNPPYVAAGDPYLREGDLRFEPQDALTTGGTGLEVLERLVREAPAFLQPGGWLLLEFGFDQADAVSIMLQQAGYEDMELFQDFQGHTRVVAARYKSS